MKTAPNIKLRKRYRDDVQTWTFSDTRGGSDYRSRSFHKEWDESRYGMYNFDWHATVQAGENASSPFSTKRIVINERSAQPFTWLYHVNNPGQNPSSYSQTATVNRLINPAEVIDVYQFDHLNPSPFGSSDAIDRAYSDFYGHVGSAMSPLKGLTFLGEFRDTARMIHRPFQSIFDSIRSFHAWATDIRRRLSGRQALDAIRRAWLELQYGWKPLLGDAADGMDAYISLASHRRTICTGIGYSQSVTTRGHAENVVYPWTGYPIGIVSSTTSDYHKCKIIGAIDWRYYSERSPDALSAASTLGFKLKEFIPTLWELVPYSFVIDGFAAIGDWLNAAIYADTEFVYVSVAEKFGQKTNYTAMPQERSKYTVLSEGNPPAWCTEQTVGGQDLEVAYEHFRRTPGKVSYRPSVVLKVPGFSQWVNYVALLPDVLRRS